MTTMGVNMDAFNRAGLNNINSLGDEYGGDEYDDNERIAYSRINTSHKKEGFLWNVQ